MNYEDDYEETMSALDAALRKRELLDAEIQILEERGRALEVLIRTAYPYPGRLVLHADQTQASAIVNCIQPTVTDRVRGLLVASSVALTSGEINLRLRDLGEVLAAKTNPWALIHGICRRLVEQGHALEVLKEGKKAWVAAR